MTGIIRKNIDDLQNMGYEIEEIPELNEIRIILRSNDNFGFALYIDYYDLHSDYALVIIVKQFNRMITGKLVLEE